MGVAGQGDETLEQISLGDIEFRNNGGPRRLGAFCLESITVPLKFNIV